MTCACVRPAMRALALAALAAWLGAGRGDAMAQGPGDAGLVPAPADLPLAAPDPVAPPACFVSAPADILLAHSLFERRPDGDEMPLPKRSPPPPTRVTPAPSDPGPARDVSLDDILASVDVSPGESSVTPRAAIDEAAPRPRPARPFSPQAAPEHFGRGMALLECSRSSQALPELETAVRSDGCNAEALAGRGMARSFAEPGRMADALADLEAAIRLDPRCDLAYLARGLVRIGREQIDEAMADFNEVIRLENRKVDGLLYRGYLRSRRREDTEAITDLTEAIHVEPRRADLHLLRGSIWSMRGKAKKAIADFTWAIWLAPDDVNGYFARGMVCANEKEYDNAIADFNDVIRLDPRHAAAHVLRGEAWRDRHEYASALADLEEAVRLDPENADARLALAWLRATCPDPKVRDGKKAIELAQAVRAVDHEDEASNLETLAAAHAEAGDFEKAVEVQTRANSLLTDDEARNKGESRLRLYRDHRPYRLEE